jgi:hypothetical protein
MVGVESASGGGSESTDLAGDISHPVQPYEAQDEKGNLRVIDATNVTGKKGRYGGT